MASPASAQYPGRITKTDKGQPVLRSVAVLEWTGEPGKPSASRLVPVTVYDGEHLNDGTIYLNRPEPLALQSGVEYELEMAGKPAGLFDVFGAGESQGAWSGFGVWRPLTAATQKAAKEAINTSALYAPIGDADDDKPVLKRKHPKGTDSDPDSSAKTASGSQSGPSSQSGAGIGSASSTSGSAKPSSTPVDPDRPTLKRKSTDDSSAAPGSGSSTASAPAPNIDPDRPTLHRSHNAVDDSLLGTSTAPPDPDRPRLKRGKPAELGAGQAPALVGYPPSMQQAVAVSDAVNHTEHPWKYTWANPADELKMKAALEDIARKELGLTTPPPAPAKPARKTAQPKQTSPGKTSPTKTSPRKTSMTQPAEPPAPAPLADEEFRVFELTYGGSATLVLTASTPPPPAPSPSGVDEISPDETPAIRRGKPTPQPAAAASPNKKPAPPQPQPKPAPQKFVTLIAQPDLYGGVLVIYKSVTDAAHLDEKPRLRLVDAVDAMGDNRGELLFELRGSQQRQFALFRVLRGSAQQLFATVQIP